MSDLISRRIVRRFDDLGRILIPKEVRRKFNLTEGIPMEIFTDKYSIILRKYEEDTSDDVCEWECNYSNNQYSYLTSCDKIFEFDSDYKFCPYCGKKIKVVE